jgi:hypothetical protein
MNLCFAQLGCGGPSFSLGVAPPRTLRYLLMFFAAFGVMLVLRHDPTSLSAIHAFD